MRGEAWPSAQNQSRFRPNLEYLQVDSLPSHESSFPLRIRVHWILQKERNPGAFAELS